MQGLSKKIDMVKDYKNKLRFETRNIQIYFNNHIFDSFTLWVKKKFFTKLNHRLKVNVSRYDKNWNEATWWNNNSCVF